MHTRINFIPRNEGFECGFCRAYVAPARGTFRNHCPQCLASKHVDGAVPGDRAGVCGGMMPAIRVEGSDPDTLTIIQQCSRCGHVARNRRAPDDDFAQLQHIMGNVFFS